MDVGPLAAPNPEALRKDVELTKAMGFNGARKHQNIEDSRYLHWADQLGPIVWGEMPSAYKFSRLTAQRVAGVPFEIWRRAHWRREI